MSADTRCSRRGRDVVVVPLVCCRFKDDPFLVTAIFRHTNSLYNQAAYDTYVAAAAAAVIANAAPPVRVGNTHPTCLPQPRLRDPALYVDEYVGGQFGWGKCEVVIDGVKIDNGNMEDQGYHYAAVNRAFATERLRLEKYGRPMRGVAHSGERVVGAAVAATEGRVQRPAVTAMPDAAAAGPVIVLAGQAGRAYVPAVPRTVHPRLSEAMEMFSFDGQYASEPITFRLGFDGK